MDGVARGEISRKFATLWLVARSRAFRCFFFHARRVLLGSSATVDGFDFRAMDRVVMCSDARREATAQPVCRLAQGTQARLNISFRLSLLAFVRPPHFPVARSSPLSAGLSLSVFVAPYIHVSQNFGGPPRNGRGGHYERGAVRVGPISPRVVLL